MDSPYDMNKTFTPEESRSQIGTLLASVQLNKYMEIIMNVGVDFHAFCNLTREDLRRIGIINFEDQTRLIDLVRPMATMYKELEKYNVTWNQVMNNLTECSAQLAASLILMNKLMKSYHIDNQSLVDSDTPSFRASLVLIRLIQSRIDLIDQDLKELLQKAEDLTVQEQKARATPFRKKVVVSSVLALAVASAVWYCKARR